MCYEIVGVGWKGNNNFYNNLIPDLLGRRRLLVIPSQ